MTRLTKWLLPSFVLLCLGGIAAISDRWMVASLFAAAAILVPLLRRLWGLAAGSSRGMAIMASGAGALLGFAMAVPTLESGRIGILMVVNYPGFMLGMGLYFLREIFLPTRGEQAGMAVLCVSLRIAMAIQWALVGWFICVTFRRMTFRDWRGIFY